MLWRVFSTVPDHRLAHLARSAGLSVETMNLRNIWRVSFVIIDVTVTGRAAL
jgi:hypothetical protein